MLSSLGYCRGDAVVEVVYGFVFGWLVLGAVVVTVSCGRLVGVRLVPYVVWEDCLSGRAGRSMGPVLTLYVDDVG